MTPCPQHVFEAYVLKRQVAVYHQDVGEIAQIPKGTQIHARNVGNDAKADNHQTQNANHIDKGLIGGDTVRTHLGEGHKAHQTGESEQAKAKAYKQGHKAVSCSAASGQRAAGCQEFFQLAEFKPGVCLSGQPHSSHNNHKTGQGADNDGIQEYTQRLYTALIAGMSGICRCCRHGNGSLAGLIRHQTSLNALA